MAQEFDHFEEPRQSKLLIKMTKQLAIFLNQKPS